MEFTDYSCPVCEKRFVNGDDVVVCPECGAPHHRECFEQLGHCFYEDRHSPGFSFDSADNEQSEQEAQTPETVICPNCKAENEKTSFYCCKCGIPLNAQDRNGQQANPNNGAQQSQGGQTPPFGFGAAGAPAFDPLAGLNSEDEIGEGVKVGEAAKHIGKNTQYYLRVFDRINKVGASRFNFAAFLLSGAFFIYRKMYVQGIIIILLMIGLTVGSTYLMLSGDWYANYNTLLQSVQQGEVSSLSVGQMIGLLIPALLSSLRLLIMLFCGLKANRTYYNYSMNVIREIKKEENEADVNKTLEARGGVNLPMAVSFFASFIVIYEICNFLGNQNFWS